MLGAKPSAEYLPELSGRCPMNWNILTTGGWLLHTAIGGGLPLLARWFLMASTKQPAPKQRLCEWSLLASLLLALLCLGPRWLTVTVPVETVAAAETPQI